MHSKSNRHTTCSLRTMTVLGAMGAVILPLAIFSDPHHPMGRATALPTSINYVPPVAREESAKSSHTQGYKPDLDVRFSDWEFGSHIPTDNGAAEYMRQRREKSEFPNSCTEGGPKVIVQTSTVTVLLPDADNDPSRSPRGGNVIFSLKK
jgi:hypothetical protein